MSRSWAGLGRSWVAFGCSWGCSWPLLGLLDRSWAALGRSWAVLGTVLAALGALLAVLGAPKVLSKRYFSKNDALSSGSTNLKVRQTQQNPGRQQHVLPANGFSIVFAIMW